MYPALVVLGGALSVGVQVVTAVDSVCLKLPLYRMPRAVILDIVLGQAENFEYAGSTTPTAPPKHS